MTARYETYDTAINAVNGSIILSKQDDASWTLNIHPTGGSPITNLKKGDCITLKLPGTEDNIDVKLMVITGIDFKYSKLSDSKCKLYNIDPAKIDVKTISKIDCPSTTMCTISGGKKRIRRTRRRRRHSCRRKIRYTNKI